MNVKTMKDFLDITQPDGDAAIREFMTEGRAALARLVEIAVEGQGGQSNRVANFLLAWWNASRDGGFDFTHLWNVDEAIARDMMTATAFLATTRTYAGEYGHQRAMEHLVNTYTYPKKRHRRA